MTWHVSPEEWLLDFTVIPRGRARGGMSLDVIDDRLREMLAPPAAPPAGIVIPTITAGRSAKAAPVAAPPAAPPSVSAPAVAPPPVAPPRRPSAPQPSAPLVGPPPVVGPPPAPGLSVELRPVGAAAPAPTPPQVGSTGVVIPSLTRPGGAPVDDDDDDALALERLSPIGGPDVGIGIPHDDADDPMDMMAMVAASAPLLPDPPAPAEIEPEPEPEPEEVALAPEPEPEPEEVAVAPEPEPESATEVDAEIEDDALEVQEDIVEARETPVDRPPPKPAPGPAAPPAAPPPRTTLPGVEKVPPRPPTVPPSGDKGPPRPPPTPGEKAGPPRPPPVSADKGPPRPPPDKTPPRPPSAPRPAAAPAGKKRGWYDEVFADHYAAILPADADVSAELDAAFVQTCLDLTSGQTLLDVGCGDGRHAHAFARLGLQVTALDNSMAQLLRAARRNDSGKYSFDILHGDMRALPRDRAYDVVTCLGTTFGYFETDEQNRQCLQDMVEVLKPGGKLVLQMFNRDYLMGVLPCRSWWQGRGCLVLDVADMHFFTGRVRVHRTIVFEDGRQFEHHISIRAYSAHTLAKMIASLGARVLEISGSRDTRGRFYGASSPDIWIFAQRDV